MEKTVCYQVAITEQSEVGAGERVILTAGWTGEERDPQGRGSQALKRGQRVERPSHLEVSDSKRIIGDSGVWLPGHPT